MKIPSYPRRPHRSGQARITVHKKDIYLGRWGSKESKKEYARIVAELAAENPSPSPPIDPSRMTVDRLCALFLLAHESMPKKERWHYARAIFGGQRFSLSAASARFFSRMGRRMLLTNSGTDSLNKGARTSANSKTSVWMRVGLVGGLVFGFRGIGTTSCAFFPMRSFVAII